MTPEWKDIASAPKDGRIWVLLWTKHSSIPGVGAYLKPGLWMSADGGIFQDATHWMELPPAPTPNTPERT